MKYKTLFRLALKVVGVFVVVQGALDALSHLWAFAVLYLARQSGGVSSFNAVMAVGGCLRVGIGMYLFFGGKWIVDMAIPGNRPYCHECGYDLTGVVRNRCPECGTPFKVDDVRPPGVDDENPEVEQGR